MQKTNFGKKLYLLRTDANFTQEGVASTLGISQRTYSGLENDDYTFKFEYIYKLAQLYQKEAIEICAFLLDVDMSSVAQTQGLNEEQMAILFNQLAQSQETIQILQEQIKFLQGQK